MSYKKKVTAAKAHAKRHGIHGKAGGWIYMANGETPLCQGWWEYANKMERSGVVFQDGDGRWNVLSDEEIRRRSDERWERLMHGGKTKAEWLEDLKQRHDPIAAEAIGIDCPCQDCEGDRQDSADYLRDSMVAR